MLMLLCSAAYYRCFRKPHRWNCLRCTAGSALLVQVKYAMQLKQGSSQMPVAAAVGMGAVLAAIVKTSTDDCAHARILRVDCFLHLHATCAVQIPETLPDEVVAKMHGPPKPEVPRVTTAHLVEADGILLGFPTR